MRDRLLKQTSREYGPTPRLALLAAAGAGVATQKLIIKPPYSYRRNPMALGTIVAYLGLSVIAGSPGAGLLWLLGAATLLIYIKVAEEREMVARFGEAYLAYRRRVPFIIPRLRTRLK